jgi:hypothetical protein
MRFMRQSLATLVLATTTLTCLAQAPTPAAAAPASTEAKVVRWQPGGAVETVGANQMKMLSVGDVKVGVVLVDLWKESTAARIQVTNLSGDPVNTSPEVFTLETVRPKQETMPALPPMKLSDKIRKHADSEAEMAGQQAMHYASANGAGEKDLQNQLRAEGAMKADYIKDSAFGPTVQPRYQTIGHIYFPYLKKRDEVVVRMTVGSTTVEFPFTKDEIVAGAPTQK